MASKTIKISEENYRWLLEIAAEMQKRYGKPVSFDETLYVLKGGELPDKKLSSLAGGWEMSDKEFEKIEKYLKKGWKKWKIPSV